MKILRARIENFRLLREIEFDFATSTKQPLTVVRAANESGKTTLLTALQWGLFGDDTLPGKGRGFRLSPLDASNGEQKELIISVEIDYAVPVRNEVRQYRIYRSATETVSGDGWKRGSTEPNLYHLTENGANQIARPEARIRSDLPEELRQVFFTEGDKAVSFIQGDRDDQSKSVEGAIRSLLGIKVIENSLHHLGQVSTQINKKVGQAAVDRKELEDITRAVSEHQKKIQELEKQLKTTTESYNYLHSLAEDTEKDLTEALRRGNREDLEKQKKNAQEASRLSEREAQRATRDLANLFKAKILGRQLLAMPFLAARTILDEQEKQGKIPKRTIPVLEHQLGQSTCICGESLDKEDPNASVRRDHIQHLIEASQNADEVSGIVTTLLIEAKDLLTPVEGLTWRDEYSEVFDRRENAKNQTMVHREAEREAEVKISKLPDVNTRVLQEKMRRYRDQARNKTVEMTRLSTRLDGARRELKEAERKRDKLLEKDVAGKKFAAELTVAKDLEDVMRNALETMKTTELEKVSERMNELFLKMIGADASDESQRSIIKRAEITPGEFRIVVFGRRKQPLSPSEDLNGASRRALTMAFILALTKVSNVEAPNVIDTPLGMMSGYVKTAFLQLAIQHCSQLVLFLTHDEIKGCEDILDRFAGQLYTLTNPAHYPKILINDPDVSDIGVLLCNCDHRNSCELCKRREAIDETSEAHQSPPKEA